MRPTTHRTFHHLVKYHAHATAALANLDASATWATASAAAVESARKRYDKGAGDVLELLAAEASVADAQQERVRCLSEWRAAKLRLFADAGVLGLLEVGAPLPDVQPVRRRSVSHRSA